MLGLKSDALTNAQVRNSLPTHLFVITHSVIFLRPTVSSRLSVPPRSPGSHKSFRFGLWITLHTKKDSIYLLTYTAMLKINQLLSVEIISIHTHHWWRSTVFSLNKNCVFCLCLSIESISLSCGDKPHVTINGKQRPAAFHWTLLQEIGHGSIVAIIWICCYHC